MKFDVSLQSLSEAKNFCHSWLEATANTEIRKNETNQNVKTDLQFKQQFIIGLNTYWTFTANKFQ